MKSLINLLILIFLSMNVKLLKCVSCFNVKFRAIYDAEIEPFNTQIYKREMTQFFDKASYSFNGFKKVESIPVLFPIDICILNLEGVKYAASLHKKADGTRHFTVHKMNNGTYQLFVDLPTPHAIAMDCRSLGSRGYIAVAYNFSTPVENAREGSPIYELSADNLRAIQYFAAANLTNVYLRVQGNDLMLLQTFKNTESAPNLDCPYFRWSGSTFNRVGRIPCNNARHLEPFSIDYENYVAVANYADQLGRTSTYSKIYKFVREKKKFQLFQKIKTNGAVDVRYFSVPVDEARRQHFLIFGNSLSSEEKGKNLEADSIFYIFDKGQFVPYQSLTFYAVEQFLPIKNIDAEKFLLLVASSNQDIKIYNLNDWKFEESNAQFTEGALGKGVARMRIFQEQEESYLVVANEKMADNETNIFLPIFKQEEHANAFRQQIIEWAKENMERLKQIDVEKLKYEVEQKLKNPYSTTGLKIIDIPNAHIENVITESLTSHRLHMDSNYWKALSYAQRALNVLEKQHKPHQMHKREALLAPANSYDFETIKVDTLIVSHTLEAENVNGVQCKLPEFKDVKAKEIVVTGKYFAPALKSAATENLSIEDDAISMLNVENLTITGKINGLSWHDLFNNTLKREGVQFIKSPASFQNMSTKSIAVSNGKIKNMNLAKLVPINGGDFVVFQHIQFDGPIIAKNVLMHERLNQIHILQHKFDVLLKKSNTTQVITAPKQLRTVRLLQPIIVAGTISSNHLRAISPNKAVHKDLILQGDYVINGEVVITKTLTSTDFLHLKSNTSLKNNLNNGLPIDTPLEEVNIKFETPIEANNTVVSFVNTKDMQQLLKSNTTGRQLVEGLKIFKRDLMIQNGLNDVKFINGFDTEILAAELLLKTSNQTITAPMQFGKILAKRLKASKLVIHNKHLNEFLSKSGKQHVNGRLKVEKINVDNFMAQNLNTNGNIFNKPLADIYQYKHMKSPKAKNFQNTPKITGTVYVKNLIINGSLNEKLVMDLERQLQQLEGNIKYVGNYNFNYEMNIKNLTFLKQLNGIVADDFGKCWLQKTGTQVFKAPQTFANVKFNNGAALKGHLNGFALNDFYEQTFWIDRDEYLQEAKFLNPIELQKSLNTKMLNGLEVPNDFLYHSFKGPQILKSSLLIEKNLEIEGNIINATNLNFINIEQLKVYLYSFTNRSTLYLENANFTFAPKYQTLNKYELQQFLNTIWLANENVVLPHHVEISEANFEGLLDLEGPINNMNLKYLQENYLSRSKQQIIPTEAIFMKTTTFDALKTHEMNLQGSLMEAASKLTINFDEFVSNTLKTSGFHEIRNNWTLHEAAIAGSMKDITVNEMNLAKHVVRLDAENCISAEKRVLTAATIEKLFTFQKSTVHGIDIENWFQNAVFLNRNQTIYGATTLENANIKNLYVTGYVNNKKFSEKNVWLRDNKQHVTGNVTIRNKLATDRGLLVNNINNLYAEYINAKSVNDFLGAISKNKKTTAINVESHLIFEQPLVVADYSSNNKAENFKWKRQTSDLQNNWNGLEQALNALRGTVKDREMILKDIKLKEILTFNASKLIYLPILINGEILNLIGFVNNSSAASTKPLHFYCWNKACNCFMSYNEEIPWLPKNPQTLEILKLLFGTTDYITVNRPVHGHVFGNNTISSDGFKELLKIKNGKSELLTPFKLQNKECFMTLDTLSKKKVKIYCLDLYEENSLLLHSELETDIQQMVMLTDHLIAVLVGENVEIWSTYADLKFQERLLLTKSAKQLAACHGANGVNFLVVVTSGKSNALLQETLEIYSSWRSSSFQHQQTIELDTVVEQIELHELSESKDQLLLLRTKSPNKSLLIYQHQGVKGFQQIFNGGILNVSNKMQILHFKNVQKHFVVLFSENNVTIVEIVLSVI